jgi:hypothetical protein
MRMNPVHDQFVEWPVKRSNRASRLYRRLGQQGLWALWRAIRVVEGLGSCLGAVLAFLSTSAEHSRNNGFGFQRKGTPEGGLGSIHGRGGDGREVRGKVGRCTQQSDDGRIAMVKLGHCIEQMGDQPCSVGHCRTCNICGRGAG